MDDARVKRGRDWIRVLGSRFVDGVGSGAEEEVEEEEEEVVVRSGMRGGDGEAVEAPAVAGRERRRRRRWIEAEAAMTKARIAAMMSKLGL